MKVRIHSALGRYPWAKLWYLCRALDEEGSGKITLNLHSILFDLGIKSISTIYHWIEKGKECGAFRATSRVGSMWHLYLGSLHNVCQSLGLPDWGTTFLINIDDIRKIRQLTTAAITFNLQEQSRGEAIRNVTPQERKTYRLPDAEEIIAAEGKLQLTSRKTPPSGATIPFLLWVSESKAFVSRSFVPFGGSQKTIAARLGVCDRTVRRHHVTLNLQKRQLVQTKAEYRLLHDEIAMFSTANLVEANGLSQRSAHHTEIVTGKTFKLFGRTWIHRCNLYASSIDMVSMKASKRAYWMSFGIDYDREILALQREWHLMGMPSREFWRSDFLHVHKEALWDRIRYISTGTGEGRGEFS